MPLGAAQAPVVSTAAAPDHKGKSGLSVEKVVPGADLPPPPAAPGRRGRVDVAQVLAARAGIQENVHVVPNPLFLRSADHKGEPDGERKRLPRESSDARLPDSKGFKSTLPEVTADVASLKSAMGIQLNAIPASAAVDLGILREAIAGATVGQILNDRFDTAGQQVVLTTGRMVDFKPFKAAILRAATASLVTENTDFLSALEKTRSALTPAAVRGIIRQFVAEDAPSQVNLPSAMRNHIVGQWARAEAADPVVVPAGLFDDAEGEITQLVNQNFLEKLKTALIESLAA